MKIDSITFNEIPALTPLNSKEWYLVKEFTVTVKVIENGIAYSHEFFLPKGFITDLRSGPDIVRWVLPKWGNDIQHFIFILLHDFLYCKNSGWSKANADALLVDGLRFKTPYFKPWPEWKCKLIAAGLKIAGGSRFGKDPIRIWNIQKQRIDSV